MITSGALNNQRERRKENCENQKALHATMSQTSWSVLERFSFNSGAARTLRSVSLAVSPLPYPPAHSPLARGLEAVWSSSIATCFDGPNDVRIHGCQKLALFTFRGSPSWRRFVVRHRPCPCVM